MGSKVPFQIFQKYVDLRLVGRKIGLTFDFPYLRSGLTRKFLKMGRKVTGLAAQCKCLLIYGDRDF